MSNQASPSHHEPNPGKPDPGASGVMAPESGGRELRLALDLTEPGSASIAAVGGKAVNLHRMLLAELPVPRGFCLTTHAYRTALEQLGAGRLRDLFAGIRAAASSPDDLASIAGEMRQAVGSLEVPEAVRTIVLSSYRRLGRGLDRDADVAVAVRSSATAEDLADASFAGQQDSFLNVVGETALLEAVRACWMSLWTDRAVVYRAGHGIDPAQVALAVVVQRMVDAEAAGVMFTADPVTGSRSHTVVDANHGLGESVVSGEINPDRFVIDTASERIVRRTLGDKHLAVRSLPGGGVTRELLTSADRSDAGSPDAPPPEAALSDAQLVELTRLGTRAAELFDAPQDTEWALDARGDFWLTQSRPVTTLFPLVHFVTDARSEAVPPARPGPRLFFCASLAQGLTRPITPLGRGAFRLLTAAGARLTGLEVPDPRLGAPFYAEGGERIFGDVTTPLRNPVGRRLMRLALTYMEARSESALVHLEEDPDFALLCRGPQVDRRHEPNRVRAVFGAVAGLTRFWAATRVPTTALLALCAPDRALRRIDAEIEALRHSLDLPACADARQRLDAVETLLSSPRGMVMPAIAGYAIPGFLGFGLAGWLLRGRIGEGELQAVLRGLPNNVTTQMNLELWDLSRRPRPVDSAPGEHDTTPTDRAAAITTTDPGLEGFLRRWGDRAVAEIDLGMPRWREQPDQLLATLRNYALVTEVSQGPRAVFERGRAEGEAAVQALLDRADNPVRRVLLGLALDRARQLVGLREAPKFGLITLLARAREQFLLIGAELVDAGLLDSADDVALLDLFSLRTAVESLSESSADTLGTQGNNARGVVTANRLDYERELRRRHIPRLLLSDGTEVEALAPAAHAEPGVLVGTPASAGVVTGIARVVSDPVGAHLSPGEILVAPSTDPGWTPLFLTAGGLVMEMGGSNSHGAVVAREYGIPAVVGVASAAAMIRSGQQVTVDGAAGTVRVREEPGRRAKG